MPAFLAIGFVAYQHFFTTGSCIPTLVLICVQNNDIYDHQAAILGRTHHREDDLTGADRPPVITCGLILVRVILFIITVVILISIPFIGIIIFVFVILFVGVVG